MYSNIKKIALETYLCCITTQLSEMFDKNMFASIVVWRSVARGRSIPPPEVIPRRYRSREPDIGSEGVVYNGRSFSRHIIL